MRIETLDKNRLPFIIKELKQDLESLKNAQFVGGSDLLGYINTVSDAPYDYSRTETGAIDRSILVSMLPDNQLEPAARLQIEVYLDGTTLWTPENAVAENFDVLIFESGEFVTTWEVLFIVGSARSYTAKFYVIATDTGTVEIIE